MPPRPPGSPGGLDPRQVTVADGVHVVLSGRRERVGKQAVRELAQDGGSASFVVADMDSPESTAVLFDPVVSEYGRLACAVNNAGLAHETLAITDADSVKFRESAVDERDGFVPVRVPAA
ncbi:SDR family NAD(P)-dependent oxidoreductase [Actinacidiphila glaucinigra]|uniref:SDR family NAD(P)-dependent oxidoreductase n=1 Tax=Actinacidiphila glaucinigra TaxID=235986 RepID=UPI00366EA884